MIIRKETVADENAIHRLNASAFPKEDEANLVDTLRTTADFFLSLVAENDNAIVGHILFTEVVLDDHPTLQLAGLAPMAVQAESQNKGIGSALIKAGLAACKEAGIGAVVVLGHPEYYPRFGFTPASRFGLSCAWDVPDEVFMAQELRTDHLRGATGQLAYHPAFNSL